METFFTFLERRIDDCSSLLCVGLDPHPDDLPAPTPTAALDFCRNLIKQTSPYAAAFKPNAAFFEALGPEGWSALKEVIAAVREESNRLGSMIPVILDAKRGDIASTAEAYARSAFVSLGAHAITLSPYLGRDSIDPFLTYKEKGVFLLCKTSNPGARDLQDLILGGSQYTLDTKSHSIIGGPWQVTLFEHVARLAQEWNVSNNIGLVVGATQLEALRRARAAAPSLWFLVPGVGVQGGDLEAALLAGLRADGKGMLISVSRFIARADHPAKVAAELRDEMLSFIGNSNIGDLKPNVRIPGPKSSVPSLADALLEAGCIKFGEFILKSGLKSPIYIDLRRLISFPKLLAQVGEAYLEIFRDLQFDRIAALPYAAIPIATAVSLMWNTPMIYPRKEAKDYGTKAEIEGEYRAGETVVVIDDLATTGGSKFEAIEKLTAAGLKVHDVVVLIDRQSGAREALEAAGYNLHAVLTMTGLLDHWERDGKVEKDRIAAVREFLANEG